MMPKEIVRKAYVKDEAGVDISGYDDGHIEVVRRTPTGAPYIAWIPPMGYGELQILADVVDVLAHRGLIDQ